MKAAKAAFDASVDSGITFFDTAEVYGSRVMNNPPSPIIIFPLEFMRKEEFTEIMIYVQLSFGAINSETLLGR